MTRVVLSHVSKSFSKVEAVKDLSLEIQEGEFLTLLGPSGCGKTTALRLILGALHPDKGDIYFDDEPVTNLPLHERNVGIVYQNYALFPNLTARENVAFGLRVRQLPQQEIAAKTREAFKLLQIEGLEERYPRELSGGQQQRVALARTLVVEPRLLLLDEPLSNLDAKLRANLRHELRNFQKWLGITTIYVTHDQEEALAISDRIAIMNNGQVIQLGKPLDVYFHPRHPFAKEFFSDV
ncbi:MAG: ABC transporter ATP-binding protein, partial [Dehalococcoidia bacterium]|nr:ABC transporter ATP-binding protein [Dehalococcoidia bacterium]